MIINEDFMIRLITDAVMHNFFHRLQAMRHQCIIEIKKENKDNLTDFQINIGRKK